MIGEGGSGVDVEGIGWLVEEFPMSRDFLCRVG